MRKKRKAPLLERRPGGGIRLYKPRVNEDSASPFEFFLDMERALVRANNLQAKFDVITRCARRLGFERCAYGVRIFDSFTRPKTRMINNYSAAWQQRYQEAGYLAIDPSVAHGLRSHAPLIWSAQLFRSTPQFWDEARESGLRYGWAKSFFDPDGSVGMLTVARSHEKLTSIELAIPGYHLHLLADAAHRHLSAQVRVDEPDDFPLLSDRELEVLRWTADGKTSEEAGILLEVSPNTIKFHMKKVIEKLSVANKVAAIARVVSRGLLV
ncbi:autoinducer binding domain-containing protein [Variovorax sp. Varisp41]|uniref:autoinducer binding domain-containing protein n=1 Tax=Variovorax sp. Varisp41 TaxID=3243033 RepID=UPI0039B4C4F8